VNDVLSISKIESGNMNYYLEDIDVVPIVNAVFNDIKIEAERKNMNLSMDID
jgi:signal transduction histidine kinase